MHYNRGVFPRHMQLSSITANDLALLCSDSGSEEAWREFVRRFQRPIAISVMRTARDWGVGSPAEIDDLVQETFLRLCADNCRLLKGFVPRDPDSIIGYLKVVAANVTHDKLRSERAAKRGGTFDRVNVEPRDLDSILISGGSANEIDRRLQNREIDELLQSFVPGVLAERDRVIFWLYFEQGFSAREIGGIQSFGLSVKGVESSIHRTTQQLKAVFLERTRPPGGEGISKLSTPKGET